ncbi:MAG TPA: hypothetical protein VEQ66_15405 [Propionibacteriaceae bacterium]|nr:hypothetical protein [Propionibacteriaceae bacterium]
MSQAQPATRPAATAQRSGASTIAVTEQSAPADAAAPVPRRRETPQLLRSLTSALIGIGLLFGLTGVLSFAGFALALNRAEDQAAQLIRVQQIQTNLLSADANATNAFLVGGLEPPGQRARYDDAIAATGRLVSQAADAQPADAAALSALNQSVLDYAVTIEQARANNRQGFPVGAQYLRNASGDLRGTALPILRNLVEANSSRARDAMSSLLWLVFPIVGLLALAATTAAMIWVALRFRRKINPGLVAAVAVLLVFWVVGLVVLIQTASQVRDLRDGAFSSVTSTASVRIEANNAKSNESLTLIARGSGASFEQAWAASAQVVDQQLGRPPVSDLRLPWTEYRATHQEIRRLDNGGSWDAAVKLATGSGDKSSNATFLRFDQASRNLLDTASNTTSAGLADRQPLLVVLAVLTFLAGLAAALLSRAGVATRLKEYR